VSLIDIHFETGRSRLVGGGFPHIDRIDRRRAGASGAQKRDDQGREQSGRGCSASPFFFSAIILASS
jgi:hypothetical protein